MGAVNYVLYVTASPPFPTWRSRAVRPPPPPTSGCVRVRFPLWPQPKAPSANGQQRLQAISTEKTPRKVGNATDLRAATTHGGSSGFENIRSRWCAPSGMSTAAMDGLPLRQPAVRIHTCGCSTALWHRVAHEYAVSILVYEYWYTNML